MAWSLTLVLVAGASATLGYRLGPAHAAASSIGEKLQDPLARLGYRLTIDEGRVPLDLPSLEEDIKASSKKLVPGDGKLIRLLFALRQGEAYRKEAAELCQSMKWERCDDAAVERMREVMW